MDRARPGLGNFTLIGHPGAFDIKLQARAWPSPYRRVPAPDRAGGRPGTVSLAVPLSAASAMVPGERRERERGTRREKRVAGARGRGPGPRPAPPRGPRTWYVTVCDLGPYRVRSRVGLDSARRLLSVSGWHGRSRGRHHRHRLGPGYGHP
eukprot:217586-Hanusia_phi.AAC.1